MKQAPKTWHAILDKVGCLGIITSVCIVSLLMADVLLFACKWIICGYSRLIWKTLDCKKLLSSVVSIDLGEAYVILDIKIVKSKTSILLTQLYHIENITRKFSYWEFRPINTPFDANYKMKVNTLRKENS